MGKCFFIKKKSIPAAPKRPMPGSRLRPYGPIERWDWPRVTATRTFVRFNKNLTNICSFVKKHKKHLFVNKLLTIL